MRLFFSLFLILLISITSKGSCIDSCAPTQNLTQNETHQEEHQHQKDEPNDDDCCTQFCTCFCCSISQFQFEHHIELPKHTEHLVLNSDFPIDLNLYSFEAHSKRFQPPKTA